MTLSNWAGNLDYAAAEIRHPATVEQAQQLVAEATRVKPLGTRHSFSDVADSPGGLLVALDRLAPMIQVDHTSNTVSVNAGASYSVLVAELQSHGSALGNLASLPHITVGGAIATATHGSGDGNGVMSAAVAAIEVIRADGSLVRVDRANPDLAAMAVGLGAFGLHTRIELDVEPSFTVEQHLYRDASWDQVIEHLDEVMGSAYSVSLIGDIGADTMNSLWFKHRVGTTRREFPPTLFGGRWIDGSSLRADHSLTTIGGVPGPWSERLAHFRPEAAPSVGGDELQSEYFVSRRHGVQALQALRSMSQHISPHLHGMEVRTVAADELWLSPAYERASLCLGFTWRKHPAEVQALLPDIEAALEEFDPRPHWGKLFTMPAVAERFPRMKDFASLAATHDPDRKFWSPFLDRITKAR